MTKKLTISQEQEIAIRFPKEKTTSLASEYGVSSSTIVNIARKYGCTATKKKPKTNLDKDTFLQLLDEGNNFSDIAKLFEVSKTTISKLAKKYGIKPQPKKLTIEEKEYIGSLHYNLEISTKELMEKFGISQSYVSLLMKQYGDNTKGRRDNRRYKKNDNYFNKIDTEEKAYWLGFLYADGCVYQPRRIDRGDNQSPCISLALQKQDQNHLQKFLNCLCDTQPISLTDNYASVQIYSKQLVEDLQKNGCHIRKTYNLIMPELRPELVRHFIRGYFDGDGCISHNINPIKLSKVRVSLVGFIEFLSSIKKVLDEQHIQYFEHKIPPKKCSNKINPENYFCSIDIYSKLDKKKFLDFLYKDATIYLDRKYLLYQQYSEAFEHFPNVRKGDDA